MCVRKLPFGVVAAYMLLASCDRPPADVIDPKKIAENDKKELRTKRPDVLPNEEVATPKEIVVQKQEPGLTAEQLKTLTEGWDEIGSYTLNEKDTAYKVKLYVSDSDSVADKERKRGCV